MWLSFTCGNGGKHNMPLELNQTRSRYMSFSGCYATQMGILTARGRSPLSVADIMAARLRYHASIPDWCLSFNTGDAVAYHPDGRMKIICGSRQLRDASFRNILNGLECGGLPIQEEAYERAEGVEVSWYRSEGSGKDCVSEDIWRVLARDESLLNDYRELVLDRTKGRMDRSVMAVNTGDTPESAPIIKPWRICGLLTGSRISSSSLDNPGCCLVGLQES